MNNVQWSGYEFEYRHKTRDWYWAVSIIIISCAIIAFLYDDALFGLFILIAGATLVFLARKEPRFLHYKIDDKGFYIGEKLYNHQDIHSFWVVENKFSAPRLLLRVNKISVPLLIIPIETDFIDSSVVRDFLLDFVPEEKIVEPISIKIMEVLGF